jgi:hypothetical protein
MKFNNLIPEFTVFDFAKSLNFYTQILEFTICYKRQSPDFAFLEFEGSQIMIQQQEKEDNWKVGKMIHPYGRGMNFQMDISNVDRIYNRLKNNKYKIFRLPEDHYYKENRTTHHEREILVQDPDGYLLRFSQSIGEE